MCIDVMSPTDGFKYSTGNETLDNILLDEGELVTCHCNFFFFCLIWQNIFPTFIKMNVY